MDAALFSAKGLVGVGCVLRDSTGSFIAAKATTINLQVQPREAKAMRVREALSWIKHDNRLNIIVEMDAKLVYDALYTSPISNSPFGMIIEDGKKIVESLGNVTFSLLRRFANSVAHVVARALGSMSNPYIRNSIVLDLNIFNTIQFYSKKKKKPFTACFVTVF